MGTRDGPTSTQPLSLFLTFHLELELGQACAGGHLEVFEFLHHLGQLPLFRGRFCALLLPAGGENREGAVSGPARGPAPGGGLVKSSEVDR